MQYSNTFNIEESIDLTVDGKTFYKTMIRCLYPNGLILVDPAVYMQTTMEHKVFDEVFLVFYRESGRFFSQMRIVGFQEIDGVQGTLLEQMTEPVKDQRREFYRLPTSVEAILYEYSDGTELFIDDIIVSEHVAKLADARAKDISVTGIALITSWKCLPDDKFILKLNFDVKRDKIMPICLCAYVIRTELTLESGMYNVGLRFFGLTKGKSEYLSKYILAQQKKMIVQKRVVEGDV